MSFLVQVHYDYVSSSILASALDCATLAWRTRAHTSASHRPSGFRSGGGYEDEDEEYEDWDRTASSGSGAGGVCVCVRACVCVCVCVFHCVSV